MHKKANKYVDDSHYYTEALSISVRSIFIQYFEILETTPREAIRDQISRSRRQIEDLIEDLTEVLELTDDAIFKWWFEYADEWPKGYNLREELQEAIAFAQAKLPSMTK